MKTRKPKPASLTMALFTPIPELTEDQIEVLAAHFKWSRIPSYQRKKKQDEPKEMNL